MHSRGLPIAVAIVLAAVLLPASSAGAQQAPGAETADGAATLAAKKKGKRKRCRKGYVLRTVKVKRGRKTVRVKRCKKKRRPAPRGNTGPGGQAPGGTAPLFEAPGARLEGEAARPFLERYLANSRFTDCPTGWPACAVEQRYSHFGDGSFFYCRLTPSPGSDIDFGSSYVVQNAVVEPDGTWTFNEIVPSGGNASFYEWRVAPDGTVTGVYQFPGAAPEQLGPLQYVAGARDCRS